MLWVVADNRTNDRTSLLQKLQTSPNTITFDCNTQDEVTMAIKYIDNDTTFMDFVIGVQHEDMIPYSFYRKHWIIDDQPRLPETDKVWKTTLRIVCDTR